MGLIDSTPMSSEVCAVSDVHPLAIKLEKVIPSFCIKSK